jgi:hypothetical protein
MIDTGGCTEFTCIYHGEANSQNRCESAGYHLPNARHSAMECITRIIIIAVG